MKPSAKFTSLTKQTGLFNIQAIDNIPSMMRKVLLSNEKAKNIKHTSIAMNEIQDRRKLVKIPNGFIEYYLQAIHFHLQKSNVHYLKELNE